MPGPVVVKDRGEHDEDVAKALFEDLRPDLVIAHGGRVRDGQSFADGFQRVTEICGRGAAVARTCRITWRVPLVRDLRFRR